VPKTTWCRIRHLDGGAICWHEKADGSPPDFIDITLASISEPIDRSPEMHFYYDSRADWTIVNDDLPKLGGETGTEPLN